jgi:glycosyltransferase involved in cell wall biosynthesis
MAGDGRHWLERLVKMTRPDLAVCNSRFSATCLARWLSVPRTEVVYCPVSAPSSSPHDDRPAVRRALATPADDVVVVQVSRLEAWKGQRELLRACVGLRDVPGWTCWIAGGAQRPAEAALLDELKAIARDGGIENRVRFLGERRDVPALLRAADVFCQPNVGPEPFGLSLVEALHAGLPVVTSGIGGACEIVDDSCGVLTPPGDVAAVGKALRRLITDADVRAALGRAARLRPDALCSPRQQMPRIEQVLSSVAYAC